MSGVRRAGAEEILMSCWVMVEAPEMISRWAMRSLVARMVASRSTPPCEKNRLSSAASVQSMIVRGRSENSTGSERVESGSVRWASGMPWRSRMRPEPLGLCSKFFGSGMNHGTTHHASDARRIGVSARPAGRRNFGGSGITQSECVAWCHGFSNADVGTLAGVDGLGD